MFWNKVIKNKKVLKRNEFKQQPYLKTIPPALPFAYKIKSKMLFEC